MTDSAATDAQTPGATKTPAQGIECGALRLAFTHDWARAIVEDFSLTPVPNAPAWLTGACNVEGEIVPVFDLESWAAGTSPQPLQDGRGLDRKARLLLGGRGGDRAAILFSGEARMVRHAAGQRAQPDDGAGLGRLREFALATSDTAPRYWVIDIRRLFALLTTEITS